MKDGTVFLSEKWYDEVSWLVRNGYKQAAIKVYREFTKASQGDALLVVRRIERVINQLESDYD